MAVADFDGTAIPRRSFLTRTTWERGSRHERVRAPLERYEYGDYGRPLPERSRRHDSAAIGNPFLFGGQR
jgi:hypothetical protein